jgi:hypothetical protein
MYLLFIIYISSVFAHDHSESKEYFGEDGDTIALLAYGTPYALSAMKDDMEDDMTNDMTHDMTNDTTTPASSPATHTTPALPPALPPATMTSDIPVMLMHHHDMMDCMWIWHKLNDSTVHIESVDHPGFYVAHLYENGEYRFVLKERDEIQDFHGECCFDDVIEKWHVGSISLELCDDPEWLVYWNDDLELTFKKEPSQIDEEFKNRTSFNVIHHDHSGSEEDIFWIIIPVSIANVIITIISVVIMIKQGHSVVMISSMLIGMAAFMGFGMYIGMLYWDDLGMIIGMFVSMLIGMFPGMAVGYIIDKYYCKDREQKSYALMGDGDLLK